MSCVVQQYNWLYVTSQEQQIVRHRVIMIVITWKIIYTVNKHIIFSYIAHINCNEV